MILKQGGNLRKRVSTITAVLLALSLLLSGTYAAVVLSQHDTDILAGKMTKYDATLNERFDSPANWTIGDGEIRKEISVKNTGLADGSFGNVYVRLQLKEYMEIELLEYEYYTDAAGAPILYMTNSDGSYEIFTTESDARSKYTAHTVAQLTDAVGGKTGWFVQTQANDPNGQYGKYVVKAFSDGAKSLVDGVIRATNVNHGKHEKNEECDYTPHLWDGSTSAFDEYIAWTMGGKVVTIDAWDGKPTDAWILDTGSAQGWVYWGEALAPQESTSKLMESVRLIKQPEGGFYYAIHSDMEGDRYEDLAANWLDAPQKVLDAYAPKYTVVFDSNDGINELHIEVKAGDMIAQSLIPQDPVKAGYTFIGWAKSMNEDAEGSAIAYELWDFDDDVVTEDTTLLAAWQKDTKKAYVVTLSGQVAENGKTYTSLSEIMGVKPIQCTGVDGNRLAWDDISVTIVDQAGNVITNDSTQQAYWNCPSFDYAFFFVAYKAGYNNTLTITISTSATSTDYAAQSITFYLTVSPT